MAVARTGEPGRSPVLVVIDYEAGNLRSIAKALEGAGAQVTLIRTPEDVPLHDAIVLPGVGAFGSAMARLNTVGFPQWIRERVGSGTPLLGVCLGIQLLFERSEEGGDVRGLGLLPGEVRRLPTGLKVPHMGWNQLAITQPTRLLNGIPDGAFVYFVHSYVVHTREPGDVLATTTYGGTWPAVVERDRVVGLQFHPEKSGEIGQRLLRNFVAWVATVSSAKREAAPSTWRSSPRST